MAQATNIGYKRILRFPDVTTDRLRLRVLESRLDPAIANITAHHYQSRPPRLEAKQDRDGLVSLQPMKQNFGWNQHGENSAGNLNAGFKIYYTTDGQEPDANATLYEAPFAMPDGGEVKAVAILNGEQGALCQERIGFAKKDWKLLKADSETKDHEAALAFDADPSTYWMSETNGPSHSIAIDLGQRRTISGFAYTPQQKDDKGMMAKGRVSVSDDGKSWRAVESFEFGNLINDPSKRTLHFKNAQEARYVRIESTEITANTRVAAIAEIDLF